MNSDIGQPKAPVMPASVLAQAPLGVGLLDADLRYQWINDLLAHYRGRSGGEHAGRLFTDVAPQTTCLRPPLQSGCRSAAGPIRHFSSRFLME